MLRITAFPTSSRVVAAVLVLATVVALIFAQAVRAAGEAISPDSNALTISEGSQGVYKVALAGDAPAAGSDVTVAISSDNSDVTVNPLSLTFTSADHTVGQNVVVSVAQDSDAIDERATLTHSVSGSTTYSDVTVSVSVTDDDEISIALSKSALTVHEGGDDPASVTDTTMPISAAYTVTVGAAPETEMTIAIGADPDGKVTLSSASLTFATTDTYPNTQTVTVTAADDGTTHDESVTLTHTVTGGSTAYRALSGQTVMVTVRDDDEAGITFDPTELALTEGGDAGSFTVVLTNQPTDVVTVMISSTNSDVTVDTNATDQGNQNTLIFTPETPEAGEPGGIWNTAQTVSVTAGEDADNAADSATLRHTIASDDSNYSALAPTLEVSVTDNNAGIAISETSLTLHEGGDIAATTDVTESASATYTVTVQAAPPTDMTIAVDPNVNGKVTLATVPLSFPAGGTYPNVQTITVTAVDDATTIDESVTLTHTVTGGSAAYRAFSGRTVTVMVVDDDDAGITFEENGTAITSVSVAEGAAAGSSYTVELAAPPTGDVTVAIRSDNGDVTVSPARLTFNNSDTGTAGSWADGQTVTVKAAEDANNVGESVTLTHTAASADSSYSGLSGTLSVAVTDNDAGIAISPRSLTVYEGGDNPATEAVESDLNAATYTVSVQGTPVHDVVVTITGSGSGATLDASAAPADQPVLTQTVTITAASPSVQTITVTALDDADNVDASLTLAHSIASNDARYNTGDAGSVSVSVMDDEPSVTIEPSTLDAVVEGESVMFSVMLDNDPGTAPGMVVISSDNEDVTLMGASADGTLTLTFTAGASGNHGTAQMVTVNVAADDDDLDERATLTLAVSGGVYDGLPSLMLPLQVMEPAPAPVTVRVPGATETVTVPGPTRTVTETVTVEVPAGAQVIGGSMIAMATEVDGRVLITRHDGGPSLVVDIGGYIRDESLGQTYQVVRRMDGMIVRQWVSPNSPLVYEIGWAVVNAQYTVPVGVILAIPLDDQSGAPGQLVRRFDGSGDDRIFSYDGMGQWRHVPDIPTFQALGLYWCDVTAADSAFFDRISMGPAHPATDQPARSDYPNCSTG